MLSQEYKNSTREEKAHAAVSGGAFLGFMLMAVLIMPTLAAACQAMAGQVTGGFIATGLFIFALVKLVRSLESQQPKVVAKKKTLEENKIREELLNEILSRNILR